MMRTLVLLYTCTFLWRYTNGKQIIEDGGFESGGSGWSCQSCDGSAVDSDKHGGQFSYQALNRQAGWSGPVQYIDPGLLEGQYGTLQSYAKLLNQGDSLNYKWTLGVTRGGKEDFINLLTGHLNYQNQWKKIEGDVSMPDMAGVDSVRLYFEGTPKDTEFLIDDVSLETSSSWKDEANARIDELRKRNVTIIVSAPDGFDPSGLTVEVEQSRQRFPFGTAVKAASVRKCAQQNEDDLYCSFVADNYNFVVAENAMKWESLEPERGVFRYDNADALLAWATERGMRARGHCLFWAVAGHQTPHWVDQLHGEDLVEAVIEHVDNTVPHFAGKVEGWDVNNEMTHGSFFLDQSGDPAIRVKMFQQAHLRDPDILLFVNDYNIVNNRKTSEYVKLIQGLLDGGAPVSGIGVQGHYQGGSINIGQLKDALDTLAQFELPIWVTEFDFASGNGDADHSHHAVQLENFYRLAFSHPSVHGILMWGFWDQAHWRPGAAIVNGDDLSPNLAGQAYLRLMHEEWRSTAVLHPSFRGAAQVIFQDRVFMGDFNIKLLDGSEVIKEDHIAVDEDAIVYITI